MVIPCLEMFKIKKKEGISLEELFINEEIAYQLKRNKNYYLTKSGILYSIYVKGAHGRTDINHPRKVAYGQDKDGYYRCILSNNGIHDRVRIHQLVVEQFIGVVPQGYVINHIDGNKHNNDCTNLEIITNLENIRHAWNNKLINVENNPNRIKVDVYDNYNNKMYNFTSLEDAHRLTQLSKLYMNRLRKNLAPQFHECKFKKIITGHRNTDYYIECYYNGKLFKTFNNIRDAGAYFNKPPNTVSGAYRAKYSTKLNRYTLTFPNVSTIENIAS